MRRFVLASAFCSCWFGAVRGSGPGEPLFLSRVVREQGVEAARRLSAVSLPNLAAESYSGFLHTEDEGEKEMFFWYFPPRSGAENAPLLVWLQGGPGWDSSFGNFVELGPIEVDSQLRPHARAATWNRDYGMVFVDNPVGAGFSFTGTGSGYCTDSRSCVARNLVSLLTQFYAIFPETKRGGLFLTGESYAGHYVPAFGARILEHNEQLQVGSVDHIPLKGVAIGDGWIDPVNMIPAYPEFLKNLGLASDDQVRVIEGYCNRAVNFINSGELLKAFEEWDEMLNGDIYPYHTYLHNITGSNNLDTVLTTGKSPSLTWYRQYLDKVEVRQAIHVGNLSFGKDARACETALLRDFHDSYKPELEKLLSTPSMRVLLYSGQQDIIVASALTERFLPFLQWPGQGAFGAAQRKVWRLSAADTEVAGFVREVPGFQRVIIRGAGHNVPVDQPLRALDMITRFVEGRGYENEPDVVNSFVV